MDEIKTPKVRECKERSIQFSDFTNSLLIRRVFCIHVLYLPLEIKVRDTPSPVFVLV